MFHLEKKKRGGLLLEEKKIENQSPVFPALGRRGESPER